MPYPVSLTEAVKIEQDVIQKVREAAKVGRLEAAVDIILEYVSASLCLDVIDDLCDMLADPDEPEPIPKTPEEWREIWEARHASPAGKE